MNDRATTWTPVGVDYCTAHHGIRNEDDDWCDFREDADQNLCETCDGEGELPDDGANPCPDCEGFGYTACVLRQLGYVGEADDA